MSSDYEDVVVRYGSSESPKACFRPVSCDKDFGHELDLFLFFTCLERFCRHARGIFIPFSLLSFLAWSRSKIGQKLPDLDFGCFRLWLLSLASFRILHNLGALGHTIGHDQWRMVHDWP